MARRLLVVATAFGLAACSTGSGGPQTGAALVFGGVRVVTRGTIDVGGQTAGDVTVGNYFFDPTILSGSGGQSITISIDNHTSSVHNFSLPLQQVDQDVAPGQSEKVTVT